MITPYPRFGVLVDRNIGSNLQADEVGGSGDLEGFENDPANCLKESAAMLLLPSARTNPVIQSIAGLPTDNSAKPSPLVGPLYKLLDIEEKQAGKYLCHRVQCTLFPLPGYLVARHNASGGKNDADASKNLDNRFARAQARR